MVSKQLDPGLGQLYTCSGYPDCTVAWGKPIAEKCPDCGSGYLIEKWLKAGGFAQCPNGECKYKRPLPQVEATA
jgi:DNA topoisomerase I